MMNQNMLTNHLNGFHLNHSRFMHHSSIMYNLHDKSRIVFYHKGDKAMRGKFEKLMSTNFVIKMALE